MVLPLNLMLVRLACVPDDSLVKVPVVMNFPAVDLPEPHAVLIPDFDVVAKAFGLCAPWYCYPELALEVFDPDLAVVVKAFGHFFHSHFRYSLFAVAMGLIPGMYGFYF